MGGGDGYASAETESVGGGSGLGIGPGSQPEFYAQPIGDASHYGYSPTAVVMSTPGPSSIPLTPAVIPRTPLMHKTSQTRLTISQDPLTRLANSVLANRRASRSKVPVLEKLEDRYVGGIDMVSLSNALETDSLLLQVGPLPSANISQPLTSPYALTLAFPSPLSLQLFHHFTHTASRLLVALPQNNPLLTLCTPERLLNRSKASQAGLRMGMLGVSVVHLGSEWARRNGRAAGSDYSKRMTARIVELGKRLKQASLANVVLGQDEEVDQFDTILATLLLILIQDVISADPTWSHSLEYAVRLVMRKGGVQSVLDGIDFGGTVTGYSGGYAEGGFTRRYLLENLATHEVFSCFVTQKEPSLLTHSDPWWYTCVQSSQRSWEWESVERTFGVSRNMIGYLSRVVTLDAQKRRLGVDFQNPQVGMEKVEQHLQRQAEDLLHELDVWCNGLSTLAQHVRVTCGDYIYKYMANVFILGEILGRLPDLPRIVSSIDYVLELCSEASALRQVIMLMWPLIISASFCSTGKRQKISELLVAFEPDYCEDLQVAREVIEEQWKCIDEGLGRRPYADLMMRLGKYALLI